MFLGTYRRRYFTLDAPAVELSSEQSAALDQFKSELKQGLFPFEQANCICGQKDGILLAKRDRYALKVDTYLCRDCGTLRTSPRMTAAGLRRFYENNYRQIYVGADTASEAFYAEQVEHGRSIAACLGHIADLKNLVVFDIGCGAGGILAPLRDAGCQVYGCDHGYRYLEYGRSKGLCLEHGGAGVLEKYGKANVIILSHVLEHFSDPKKELEELSQLLEDDGYIYVELPGIYNIHNVYKDTLLYLQNAHLYHYTLNTLTSLMEKAGFELVHGAENIIAVFKKGKASSNRSSGNEFSKVLLYLASVELSRIVNFRKLPAYVARIIGWSNKW